MKILSFILLLVSFNLQAEELYSSVDDYLKTITTVNEDQLKYNREHPKKQIENRAVSKNKRWYVGYEPVGTSESVFLYLLESNKQGKLKLVSRVNTNQDWKIPYLFEELAFDANDKFHFSINIVQSPNVSHIYYFKLIKNKWFLARDDRSELGRCGEGDNAEVSDSLNLSTNYLTGEVKEQRYSENDCKPLKLTKNKHKFSLVPLSDFYPFMEIKPQH
jgi:hypothetical protein